MGFRDLHSFNKALLAKQVWRLWSQPDSLAARILKAKYYPQGSVLEAKVGNKPSYAWRSIQSTGGLVKELLFWRIGNGNGVRIWGEKWLSLSASYMIYSPPRMLAADALVHELIDDDSQWWNVNL